MSLLGPLPRSPSVCPLVNVSRVANLPLSTLRRPPILGTSLEQWPQITDVI